MSNSSDEIKCDKESINAIRSDKLGMIVPTKHNDRKKKPCMHAITMKSNMYFRVTSLEQMSLAEFSGE